MSGKSSHEGDAFFNAEKALNDAINSLNGASGKASSNKEDSKELSGNNCFEVVDWTATKRTSSYSSNLKLEITFKNISSKLLCWLMVLLICKISLALG